MPGLENRAYRMRSRRDNTRGSRRLVEVSDQRGTSVSVADLFVEPKLRYLSEARGTRVTCIKAVRTEMESTPFQMLPTLYTLDMNNQQKELSSRIAAVGY